MRVIEERFGELLRRLNEIEAQLTNKADDVITVQVLQHRNELEEIELRLAHIERRIELLSQIDESSLEVVEYFPSKKQPLIRKVSSIFTL